VQAVAASAGDAEPAVAAAVPAPPPVSDATMQAQLPPTAMLATATDAPSPIASAARAAPIRTSVQLRVRPWAEVYVDGVARGVTPPLKELALPPGKHVIEFRNPGAPSKRLEIDVAADAPLIVSHRF